MEPLELQLEASLVDPDDPAEVNLVADVAGVGRTNRLATGQILTWTAEGLRNFAPSLIGQPVNVDLDEDGEPTSHSRRAVGAIIESKFDELTQTVRAKASLWRHYYPSTVNRLKEIFPEGKVNVSMEFIPDDMLANGDGSVTPTRGRFSGLGLVRTGADPRARALLMASVKEDLERHPIEVSMHLDQITEAVARKLGHRESDPKTPTITVTDAAPADSEEVQASTDQDAPKTSEETPLEITEEMRASLREELLAELKPALDAATERAETAEKALADSKADTAKQELHGVTPGELETILPAKDKDARSKAIAALDDAGYEALKAELAAAAEIKGGISTDADLHEGTEDEGDSLKLSDETVAGMVKEAIAAAGFAAPAQDK